MAVMHGANAPLMKTMVSEQMDIERKVLAGEVFLILIIFFTD